MRIGRISLRIWRLGRRGHRGQHRAVRPREQPVDSDLKDAGATVLNGHLHLQQSHFFGRRLHTLAATHARTGGL